MNWKLIINIYLNRFGLKNVGTCEDFESAMYRLVKAVKKQSYAAGRAEGFLEGRNEK